MQLALLPTVLLFGVGVAGAVRLLTVLDGEDTSDIGLCQSKDAGTRREKYQSINTSVSGRFHSLLQEGSGELRCHRKRRRGVSIKRPDALRSQDAGGHGRGLRLQGLTWQGFILENIYVHIYVKASDDSEAVLSLLKGRLSATIDYRTADKLFRVEKCKGGDDCYVIIEATAKAKHAKVDTLDTSSPTGDLDRLFNLPQPPQQPPFREKMQ